MTVLNLKYENGEMNINCEVFFPCYQYILKHLLKIIKTVRFLDDREQKYEEIQDYLTKMVADCEDDRLKQKYKKNLELVKGWKK